MAKVVIKLSEIPWFEVFLVGLLWCLAGLLYVGVRYTILAEGVPEETGVLDWIFLLPLLIVSYPVSTEWLDAHVILFFPIIMLGALVGGIILEAVYGIYRVQNYVKVLRCAIKEVIYYQEVKR